MHANLRIFLDMWNKKNKRVDLNFRAPRKRRNFFEKKEKNFPNPIFFRMIFRLLAIVFFGVAVYILFFSPFLEIKKVSLEGIVELKYEDFYKKANESLSEKYFYFIPKNNLILLSGSEIEKKLLENFKKISDVKVQKNFPDGVTIKITERKALLIWCSGDSCYIIDKNGYAYTEADFESEEVKQNNLLNVRDNSAKPIKIGEKVLDEHYIDFVISIKDKLAKETGVMASGEYQTGSRIAKELKIKTEEGWEIYFSSSLPMENSIRTLKTFLDKEISQDKRSKLEYIDLRAENKVYYKMRTDADEMQTNAD